ncbi:hypothetical protein RvY_07892 [Ramazzottius varieornatus]|uniref:ATP-dependent RNA helicase DDX42 n=1 Tax=Ramazzottius varieornatus TaxID=947166 RepID=A0A1D1V9S5_RAMVA|nr:hypothetical protein RvY_07892 [Ramazzottius varieornatus]
MSFRGRGAQSYTAAGSRSNAGNVSTQDYSRMAPPSSLSVSTSKPRTFIPPGINPVGGQLTTGRSVAAVSEPVDQLSSYSYTGHSASKRKGLDDDDYFEDDDSESIPHTNGSASKTSNDKPNEEEDEEDPLDAFMADIAKEATTQSVVQPKSAPAQPQFATLEEPSLPSGKAYRADIEEDDAEESYYRFMAENPNHGLAPGEDDLPPLEYDEDGNPIAPERSKHMELLSSFDHSQVDYPPFEKNFYEEHEEIKKLDTNQVNDLRKKLGIRVTGASAPKPVASFAHFNFDELLMKAIRKSEYTQPTPIQAQAIPAILQGRDVIGIAKTGSGKTAAYLWPMLIHVLDQPRQKPGEGPIGLILAPTRELAQQIYTEVKRFGTKVYNISTTCCAGGGSKYEQTKALKEGAEIVVATPGRLMDLIKSKATNLQRVTFLVLDEADRMLDLGFEPQVRSISGHIRPDRQTLLFSATFKKKIERLARDAQSDPIRIVQGELGEANEDVSQFVKILPNQDEKWKWLLRNIVSVTSTGSVLIFVTKKADSEDVASRLKNADHKVGLIHGDLHQSERDKVLHQFKKKEMPILVATDVAARGLDIPSIRTVINFDVARDIDTHTHRIGRTGRAGEAGTAYTLLTEKDKEFAPHLVRNLEGANQHVPEKLMELASQCSWFKKNRFFTGPGKAKKPLGGKGLGFKDEAPNIARPSRRAFQDDTTSASDMIKSMRNDAAQASTFNVDRHSAVKAAFQARFKTQFQTASAEETRAIPQNQPLSTSDTAESQTRKKKSRWQ